jgi:hypothetical protein
VNKFGIFETRLFN